MGTKGSLYCAILVVCLWDAQASIQRLENGEPVQHEFYSGSPVWKLLPLLWVPKTINITCPSTKDFKVYTASSLSQLSDRIDRNENVWCGWQALLGKHSCIARLSPIGPQHLGIQHASIVREPCSLELEEKISPVLVIQTLIGAIIFISAGKLSNSVVFRLGTGSAGFMALSVIILLLFITRHLPSKKSGMALFAIFGSSFTGLVRYVFGQWIPSIEQLIYNKVVLVYLFVSGLIGLALTYYYDRSDNDKLHFIMKCGLKIVGLVLVAFGTTYPAASITLCVALVLSQALTRLKNFWHKGDSPIKDFTDAVSEIYTGDAKPSPQPVNKPPAKKVASKPTHVKIESDVSEAEDILASKSSGTASANAFERANRVPFSDEDDVTEGSPSTSFVPIGSAETDSPFLRKGLALNMETGRTVKLHGKTYNSLVAKGYDLDRVQGTLTPPSTRRAKRPNSSSVTRRGRSSVEQ